MKPFITPELTSMGKMAFPFQCEGVACDELWPKLKDQQLVAYSIPDGHTLQAAWEFSLVFLAGQVLQISSACTQAIDWQEVGSLNLSLASTSADSGSTKSSKMRKVDVPAIALIEADKLIYEDEDVLVECGIALRGLDQEVVIAAGVSPGSVSILASFSQEELFKPQFPLSMCRRQRM